jgi:RNA polymerase sigma-70 factor (ECF subfamily)
LLNQILPLHWQSQAALYEKAVKGDADASLQLVKQLSPKAHAVAWRILGNAEDAKDVLQEAFIRLWKAHQFGGQSSLDTYFYKIVTRLCFDYLKTKHKYSVEFFDEESVEGSDRVAQSHEDALSVQQAIQLLNARQRMAISLWAYQDADVAEIAEVLEIDKNAAHQLLHRAKLNLKKILESHHAR